MNTLTEIADFIRANLLDFANTDWAQVQFHQLNFAIRAALLMLAALLFFKVVWPRLRRKKEDSAFEHSGYGFTPKYKSGILFKTFALIPWLFLLPAIFEFFVTVADPYLTLTDTVEFAETRENVYLRDVSTSFGWRYKNSNQSRAEIAQDFLLKLVASRQDKKDRSAYIVFSTLPHLIADFTTDADSLLFSIANGPIVMTHPDTPGIHPGKFMIKNFVVDPAEGSTNLYLGLFATNKLFDEKGSRKINEAIKKNPAKRYRSVTIITDGASEEDPEKQFQELQKRKIVPYLVYIDPDKELEQKLHGADTEKLKLSQELLNQVKRYGGDYFIATDRFALDKVADKLNRLQAIQTDVKKKTVEKRIYQRTLTFSFLLFGLAIISRLVLAMFHRVV